MLTAPPKLRVAAISLALVVISGLVLLLVQPARDPARVRPLPLLIGAWLAFIAAAWLLRKVPLRSAVALILLGGVAVQLVAVSAPPQNSNDLYRYIWDGRVQAAGVDPYAYVPTARQLTGLRDEFLFHPGAEYCVAHGYVGSHPAAELAAGCTAINRPTVPTIYPPVAEAYFLGVHYLPGGAASTKPIQAATALVAVLVTVLLLFGLRRLAAAALLILATARTTRRTVLGGILLGLAIATKPTPALTIPAVLARGDNPPKPPREGMARGADAARGLRPGLVR